MSWYSDGEPFDEYDPPYCERCRRTDVSYEVCKRCVRMHNEEDEENKEEEEDGDEEMAKTMMLLPETVEEFMEQNKIVDTEQIYTNGAELVPIFRMKQWFISHPCELPRWTPVTDGLPEEEGEYLVCCDSKYQFEVGRFYIDEDDDRWFGCDWNDPEDVIAWMPLPEPYKEGDQNE